jgi:hypothetical protein
MNSAYLLARLRLQQPSGCDEVPMLVEKAASNPRIDRFQQRADLWVEQSRMAMELAGKA